MLKRQVKRPPLERTPLSMVTLKFLREPIEIKEQCKKYQKSSKKVKNKSYGRKAIRSFEGGKPGALRGSSEDGLKALRSSATDQDGKDSFNENFQVQLKRPVVDIV
jgi:hypothetical protein